jgi:hypothetical protein
MTIEVDKDDENKIQLLLWCVCVRAKIATVWKMEEK